MAKLNKQGAIRVMGTDVVGPQGLVEMYKDFLKWSKHKFKMVFDIIHEYCLDKPFLIHCSHGKDRTGLAVGKFFPFD